MNGHIEEDAAGNFDISGVRRFGVARSDFQNMGFADFARVVGFADCGKVVVKAAVKADLEFDFGVFCERVGDRLNLGDRVVDRLFAEHVFARFNSGNGNVGVGIG